jgi:hypothetical protein
VKLSPDGGRSGRWRKIDTAREIFSGGNLKLQGKVEPRDLLRLRYALEWLPMFLPDKGSPRYSATVRKVLNAAWGVTPSLAKERIALGLRPPEPEEEIAHTRALLEEFEMMLRPVLELGRPLQKPEVDAFDAVVKARSE